MRALASICILAASIASLPAAEPNHDLDPKVAVKLINLFTEISTNSISVVSVMEGSQKRPDGFEVRNVSRVTTIVPLIEDGRTIRRVCAYDFYWDEQYGWYYQEIRERAGGEEVWIWSETSGEFIVK